MSATKGRGKGASGKNDSDGGSDKGSFNFPSALSEKEPLIKRPPFDFWGFRGWFAELNETFGLRLLVMLFGVMHLLKGFSEHFSGKAIPYMLKYYSVPAPQAQVFLGVASLPWAMKPIIGVMSDVFPICGYNKAPYMIVTSILGVVAFACLGSVTKEAVTISVVVMCLFFRNFQVSTCDLLAEGKYSAKIKENPEQGPNLLTYVWFGMQFGSLLAVGASGVVISFFGFRGVFFICMVPAGLLLYPLLAGYMEEPRADEEMKRVARQRFIDQPEMCFLCFVMFAGTVSLAVAGLCMPDNHVVTCVLAVAVSVIVLVCFSILLTPSIAKFNAFCLIQSCWSFSIGGAAFYFYTDTHDQYPNGPHFDTFFYNSILGSVGPVCALFGIWTYKKWLVTWNYRNLVVLTSIIHGVLNLLDVVMFTHTNRTIGIPDHAFVLGAAVVETVMDMWRWMPQLLILSYMVPQGMESTMYGLLAGCMNLGGTVSANCGALLLERLGVQPRGATGEGAMFENLWVASLLSSVMPMLWVAALWWLIPNKPQTECFKDEVSDSPCTGSLWRQWMKTPEQADSRLQDAHTTGSDGTSASSA